jgi:hypothetical protein
MAPASRSKNGKAALFAAMIGTEAQVDANPKASACPPPVRLSLEHSERVTRGDGNASIGIIGKLTKLRLVSRIPDVAQNRKNIGQVFALIERLIEERFRLLSSLHQKHPGQRSQVLVGRIKELEQLPAYTKGTGCAPEHVVSVEKRRAAEVHQPEPKPPRRLEQGGDIMLLPDLRVVTCAVIKPYRKDILLDLWMEKQLSTAICENHEVEMHANRNNPRRSRKVGHVFVNVNRATQQNELARVQTEFRGLHSHVGAMAVTEQSKSLKGMLLDPLAEVVRTDIARCVAVTARPVEAIAGVIEIRSHRVLQIAVKAAARLPPLMTPRKGAVH